jgi:Lysine-specific metallo-endopeptidase
LCFEKAVTDEAFIRSEDEMKMKKAFKKILVLATPPILLVVSSNASGAPIACDAGQLKIINSAKYEAQLMLSKMIDGIQSDDPIAAQKLITWVGIKESSGARAFQDKLKLVRNYLGGLMFLCESSTPVEKSRQSYAYVNPKQQFTVVYGNLFWPAPDRGAFSTKAGTIVHEVSHFILTGKAMDPLNKQYGTKAALENATANPIGATKNAENIEYAVESYAYSLKP